MVERDNNSCFPEGKLNAAGVGGGVHFDLLDVERASQPRSRKIATADGGNS